MQIEERKKLVSSIKNSIVSTEQEAVSYSESHISFSKFDLPSTDGELDHNFRDENLYESYAHLTRFESSEAPFIGIGEDFDKEKQPQEINQLERVSSGVDSLKELNGTAQSTLVPSLIPKMSKSHSLIEDFEELKEEVAEDASDVPDTAAEEEVVKPPPLSGTNVMNVILVAAECAPWSKTGT